MADKVKMEIEVGVDILTGEVGTLEVGPDDAIVFMSDHKLPERAYAAIIDAGKRYFGSDRKILILDEGLKVGIIRHITRKTDGV